MLYWNQSLQNLKRSATNPGRRDARNCKARKTYGASEWESIESFT